MLIGQIKAAAKNSLIKLFPLGVRMQLAVFVDRLSWVPQARRYWWAQELVKDLREKDANEYHKFLWQNHLAYAETYEIASRYGYENIEGSRKLLFEDLEKKLIEIGVDRETDIHSAFEVGCSLGYLLRYMEEDFFPSARTLAGLDIDAYAISEGARYLKSINSIVDLKVGDMESLSSVLDPDGYDIIFCLGVLMYLKENDAQKVIREMLSHTRKLLVLSGVANPTSDNRHLQETTIRTRDGTFIHNFDNMIQNEGGEIIYRRWEGTRMVENNSIYFVFARPAPS